MLDSILIEKEQKDLLEVLVETSRNVPLEKRQKFFAIETMESHLANLLHPGLPNGFPGAYMGDIEILSGYGLINLSYGSKGTPKFDVTPIGFAYYAELKRSQGTPTEVVERRILENFDSNDFREHYKDAYDKWAEAESLLWQSESEAHLTTIGHLCRESIQLFVEALVEIYNPSDIDSNVAHTVSRLRSILSSARDVKSKSKIAFIDALISYWGSVSDLIQRQEHGGLKEGEPLNWEDARRIVFQSANVMFEVDRTLRFE